MEEQFVNQSPASSPRRPLNEWLDGARDTIPMMVGAAPFGVIFGTLVAGGPLAGWHGALMSLTVFAGSAQFIALGLVAGGASFVVVLATTLIVNLRHLLYSATLAPYVAHLPLRWRATLGALMTDEVFAVAYAHYRHFPPGAIGPHYFFGSGLAMYVNWQIWTLAGLGFGSAFPGLQSLGLDFAMAATFIAIVVPQLGTLRYFSAAATAGVLAYYWQGWPYKLGLLGAVAAGVVVGVALTLLQDRAHAGSHPEAAS
ncbi:branched-chain amino acid ABC transporter permease [Burkholderia ubonensis]|uniref:AzlC family ABC transporter permease n=1 Tax=Burkholderia ubonensis TaxID=101571 RepID=UPI000757591B|nr:AzlC family ABC transporter permease [Burkholderia ubonensis]KVT67292.1 branched-chain amino acid ABC transporter permease [Burkholderia ubonensis]